MSQKVSLPPANLHEVPDSISDKEAVFAEPLAAALRIVEQKVSFFCWEPLSRLVLLLD